MDGLARILLVRGGGGDLGEDDDDRGASFNGLSAVVTTFSIGLAGIVEKDLRFATSAAAARAPVDPLTV